MQTFSCKNRWTIDWRWLVFTLASSSLACLVLDFYRICPKGLFTLFIFLPAMVALLVLAAIDRAHGDGQLWRAVLIGLSGGLMAAVAYDVFRLPFVFAREWGISSIVTPMNLF